jgi:hypothetical protein
MQKVNLEGAARRVFHCPFCGVQTLCNGKTITECKHLICVTASETWETLYCGSTQLARHIAKIRGEGVDDQDILGRRFHGDEHLLFSLQDYGVGPTLNIVYRQAD